MRRSEGGEGLHCFVSYLRMGDREHLSSSTALATQHGSKLSETVLFTADIILCTDKHVLCPLMNIH